MYDLYSEDSEGKTINEEKINKTIYELNTYPEKGEIVLFEFENEIIGYSLLINYWSNEYGGNLLCIDELFVSDAFRGNQIATDFLNYLIQVKYSNAVAIQIEVTPSNKQAKRLYEKIGFKFSSNHHYIFDFEN
jgi:GNAT superfamily N-acetyltransferase